MSLVLWIDQNTFATSLIARAFKKKSLEFYSLSQVDDFLYLIDDLRPSLIVLDEATFAKNSMKFVEQYEASPFMQEIPIIVIDPKSDFIFLKNKIGELNKPFDPFKLPEILQSFLRRN